MSTHAEVLIAQQQVITVCADILATERHLSDKDDRAVAKAARMLPKLDQALAYAMRDAVNVISELDPKDRPKDWDTSWDGATA